MRQFLEISALLFFNLFCISGCLLIWYIFSAFRKVQEKTQEFSFLVQENLRDRSWLIKGLGVLFLPWFFRSNKSSRWKKFLDALFDQPKLLEQFLASKVQLSGLALRIFFFLYLEYAYHFSYWFDYRYFNLCLQWFCHLQRS